MGFKQNKKFLFPTEEELIINLEEETKKKEPVVEKKEPVVNKSFDSLVQTPEIRGIEPKIFNPLKFDDVIEIADAIKLGAPVIVNLQELVVSDTGKQIAGRIVDYLGGVSYVAKFDIKRINGTTFLFTPKE